MLAEHGVSGREIAAIGISNQRETTLLWERESGRPLANATVWQDRRTAPNASACGARGSSPWSGTRPASSSPSATKLAWLLAHLPGAHRRAERGGHDGTFTVLRNHELREGRACRALTVGSAPSSPN